jgi:hypothetical protein
MAGYPAGWPGGFFGGDPFGGFFGGAFAPPMATPMVPAPAPAQVPSMLGVPLGGAPTSINNSGNVNLLLFGEGMDGLFGDDGSGGYVDPSGAYYDPSAVDPTAGMMAGGSGSLLASLGLTTAGPEDGEEVETAGPEELETSGLVFDDDEVETSGPEGEEELETGGFVDEEDEGLISGGPDEELATAGGDESYVDLSHPDDDDDGPSFEDILLTGGGDGTGTLFDEGEGDDGEALIEIVDPECETGSCGLF